MQSILKSLFLIFVCTLMHSISATLPAKHEPEAPLRILKLLPNLLSPLAVDPGIPEDFIALSPRGELNLCDWIYWGPKEVLEAYFKEPASLATPVIRVKITANTSQTGPKEFNHMTFAECARDMKKAYPESFNYIETNWGDYPVLAFKMRLEGNLIFMAWVGLNDPTGCTLMFNLVYPDKKRHPDLKDRQLWESLLLGTKQLQDADYFKACGQDMQEGYTLANFGGAKLKILAEKRLSDGTIQVVVTPEKNVKFRYCDMQEGLMGAQWKLGQPIVKVYGEITHQDGNFTSISNEVTTVFFKTVTDFSCKNESNSLVFQKKVGEKSLFNELDSEE